MPCAWYVLGMCMGCGATSSVMDTDPGSLYKNTRSTGDLASLDRSRGTDPDPAGGRARPGRPAPARQKKVERPRPKRRASTDPAGPGGRARSGGPTLDGRARPPERPERSPAGARDRTDPGPGRTAGEVDTAAGTGPSLDGGPSERPESTRTGTRDPSLPGPARRPLGGDTAGPPTGPSRPRSSTGPSRSLDRPLGAPERPESTGRRARGRLGGRDTGEVPRAIQRSPGPVDVGRRTRETGRPVLTSSTGRRGCLGWGAYMSGSSTSTSRSTGTGSTSSTARQARSTSTCTAESNASR